MFLRVGKRVNIKVNSESSKLQIQDTVLDEKKSKQSGNEEIYGIFIDMCEIMEGGE